MSGRSCVPLTVASGGTSISLGKHGVHHVGAAGGTVGAMSGRFCADCGTALTPGAQFCRTCGRKLAPSPARADPRVAAPAPAPPLPIDQFESIAVAPIHPSKPPDPDYPATPPPDYSAPPTAPRAASIPPPELPWSTVRSGLLSRLGANGFKRRRLTIAVIASAVVVAVIAAVVVISLSGKSGRKADNAAHPIRSPQAAAASTATPSASAFDLSTIDWDNATYPGSACLSSADITLRNGNARLPDSTAPLGYRQLAVAVEPQYTQLGADGPLVAIVGLECMNPTPIASPASVLVGSIAVFDAANGQPALLGLITPQLPGGSTSPLLPHDIQIQDGTPVVTETYPTPTDAACCPSGLATTSISYADDTLVANTATTDSTSPQPSTSDSATPAPKATRPPATGAVTITGRSGRKYEAIVLAADTITNCAANAYGDVIAFLSAHPCTSATRRLVSVPYNGRAVALSVITADIPSTASAPSAYAQQFGRIELANGTGSLNDLLRAGTRPSGWPASIPAEEAFRVDVSGPQVVILDAWYLRGATADQAPELIALEGDVNRTAISSAG
jgi:hypothetical protein